jgi:hypothetical protein
VTAFTGNLKCAKLIEVSAPCESESSNPTLRGRRRGRGLPSPGPCAHCAGGLSLHVALERPGRPATRSAGLGSTNMIPGHWQPGQCPHALRLFLRAASSGSLRCRAGDAPRSAHTCQAGHGDSDLVTHQWATTDPHPGPPEKFGENAWEGIPWQLREALLKSRNRHPTTCYPDLLGCVCTCTLLAVLCELCFTIML